MGEGDISLRSDVVHNDGDTKAMLAAEDVLQEGCLSGTLENVSGAYNGGVWNRSNRSRLTKKPESRVTGRV
jgi:hypothetical protein